MSIPNSINSLIRAGAQSAAFTVIKDTPGPGRPYRLFYPDWQVLVPGKLKTLLNRRYLNNVPLDPLNPWPSFDYAAFASAVFEAGLMARAVYDDAAGGQDYEVMVSQFCEVRLAGYLPGEVPDEWIGYPIISSLQSGTIKPQAILLAVNYSASE
jgi:hypothetical protein